MPQNKDDAASFLVQTLQELRIPEDGSLSVLFLGHIHGLEGLQGEVAEVVIVFANQVSDFFVGFFREGFAQVGLDYILPIAYEAHQNGKPIAHGVQQGEGQGSQEVDKWVGQVVGHGLHGAKIGDGKAVGNGTGMLYFFGIFT